MTIKKIQLKKGVKTAMNEEILCSNDQFPEGLLKFIDSWNTKNPNRTSANNHNLYLFQTIDMDGNVTNEAYGMNLMTKTWFENIYTKGTYPSNPGIFIGSSDVDPTLSDTALGSVIITSKTTDSNTNVTKYGMTYDSTTKICSQRVRVYVGYYDYNISGITSDVEIKEVGYGPAYNNLITHALVYDADGNKSSITKHLNERLMITMYWSICFKPDWIKTQYDKGVYIAFEPYYFFGKSNAQRPIYAVYYNRMGNTMMQSVTGNDMLFASGTSTVGADNVITSTVSLGSCYLEAQQANVCNIVASDSQNLSTGSSYAPSADARLHIITDVSLPQPEEITCDTVYTNSHTSSILTNAFGSTYPYGVIPAAKFDISSMHMYNHLTHDWDIEETYVNAPDNDYSTLSMFLNVGIYMYIPSLNKSQHVYVYINRRTDLPITSFGRSGMTMYATDEYWNPDSYEAIDDLSNINESLGTKRYYIRTDANGGISTYAELYPRRSSSIQHKITCSEPVTYKLTERAQMGSNPVYVYNGAYKILSSDQYGYLVTNCHILYPDVNGETKTYEFWGQDNGYTERRLRFITKTGDRLIGVKGTYEYSQLTVYPGALRMYDMSGDGSTAPAHTDYTLDWSSGSVGTPTYTQSDAGFLVIQRNTNVNEAIIMNIYGDDGTTPTFTKISNAQYCIALNPTNKCVYMVSGSTPLTFNVYDMSTNTVVDTFSLPTSGYTLTGIFGWSNFIYIRVSLNNAYTVFMYNINTKQLSTIDIVGDGITWSTLTLPMVSCDECMVIPGKSSAIVIKDSEPTKGIQLSSAHADIMSFSFLYSAEIKRVNNGKQLLLVFASGYRSYGLVVDLGWVLDNGEIAYFPTGNFRYISTSNGGQNIGIYKDYVWNIDYGDAGQYDTSSNNTIEMYPYQNFIPHKITGTTTTIQSYNNPKQLGGRTYSVSITNDTSKWSKE